MNKTGRSESLWNKNMTQAITVQLQHSPWCTHWYTQSAVSNTIPYIGMSWANLGTVHEHKSKAAQIQWEESVSERQWPMAWLREWCPNGTCCPALSSSPVRVYEYQYVGTLGENKWMLHTLRECADPDQYTKESDISTTTKPWKWRRWKSWVGNNCALCVWHRR